MTSGSGAFSWNSELPSGRNPFWIRDEALAGLGLHAGDAVSVDTRVEPSNGDLVVAEAEVDGGDSQRLARQYFATGDQVRLEALGDPVESLELPAESVIVMGVIIGRLRFADGGAQVTEEPLEFGQKPRRAAPFRRMVSGSAASRGAVRGPGPWAARLWPRGRPSSRLRRCAVCRLPARRPWSPPDPAGSDRGTRR